MTRIEGRGSCKAAIVIRGAKIVPILVRNRVKVRVRVRVKGST